MMNTPSKFTILWRGDFLGGTLTITHLPDDFSIIYYALDIPTESEMTGFVPIPQIGLLTPDAITGYVINQITSAYAQLQFMMLEKMKEGGANVSIN